MIILYNHGYNGVGYLSDKEMQKQFLKDGYLLLENYLDNKSIDFIKNHISKKEPKVFDHFSKPSLGRGWGNLVNDELLTEKIDLSNLINKSKDITEKPMLCNHAVVNNKPRWVGKDVEYHQEIFNSSTFAPGADNNFVRDNWIQIYLPLDDENSLNGGLCIIEGSHNFEVLDYEDCIDGNFRHKRRVSPHSLDMLTNEGCTLKPLDLKAGSLLIFSPYLVHVSPNNLSSNDRMSLVLQFRPDNFVTESSVFKQEAKFRSDFIISTLSDLIGNEKANIDGYSDVSARK
jgi:ectoine hydroxylase-related dioxygenase (phytanoyl-CoA dioxygenase family)